MGHTFTHLLTHIIFSAKGRVPYLRVEARDDVFAYMGGIIREIGGAALIIGGTVDHVHLLTKLRASIALADVLEVVKTNSSRWIHKQRVLHPKFGWQPGYAAFSVSDSNAERVRQYIANQEQHHREISFQEELVAFLNQHHIGYDPRYLWE